jgi:hypothetical protein
VSDPIDEGREPTRPQRSIPVMTPVVQDSPVHTLPAVHLPDTAPQLDHPVRPGLDAMFVELRKSHRNASSMLAYVVACIESFLCWIMGASEDPEVGSSHAPYTPNKRWSPALVTSITESGASHARPIGRLRAVEPVCASRVLTRLVEISTRRILLFARSPT